MNIGTQIAIADSHGSEPTVSVATVTKVGKKSFTTVRTTGSKVGKVEVWTQAGNMVDRWHLRGVDKYLSHYVVAYKIEMKERLEQAHAQVRQQQAAKVEQRQQQQESAKICKAVEIAATQEACAAFWGAPVGEIRSVGYCGVGVGGGEVLLLVMPVPENLQKMKGLTEVVTLHIWQDENVTADGETSKVWRVAASTISKRGGSQFSEVRAEVKQDAIWEVLNTCRNSW